MLVPMNPFASTLSRYLPESTLGKRYSPVFPETVERETDLSALVSVTDAPGTTAPLESLTVPRNEPSVDCACTAVGIAVNSAQTSKARNAIGWPRFPSPFPHLLLLVLDVVCIRTSGESGSSFRI
jgi:hypothetical protein